MTDSTQPQSHSPSNQNPLLITKKDDMKAIFRNQVDSLKMIRQIMGEVQQLNKVSQSKFKVVKENYEQQLPNFKKIRRDLDIIHKSIVKVLVCEERITSIQQQREEEQKLENQLGNLLSENSPTELDQKENNHSNEDGEEEERYEDVLKGNNQSRVLLSDIDLTSNTLLSNSNCIKSEEQVGKDELESIQQKDEAEAEKKEEVDEKETTTLLIQNKEGEQISSDIKNNNDIQ